MSPTTDEVTLTVACHLPVLGAFHEDGLADCFDGFGGGWGKSQILRIMKDSRIGTYALVGMALVLHQKLHALAALPLVEVGSTLVVAHCISRWTCIPLIYFCTYIQVIDGSVGGKVGGNDAAPAGNGRYVK